MVPSGGAVASTVVAVLAGSSRRAATSSAGIVPSSWPACSRAGTGLGVTHDCRARQSNNPKSSRSLDRYLAAPCASSLALRIGLTEMLPLAPLHHWRDRGAAHHFVSF